MHGKLMLLSQGKGSSHSTAVPIFFTSCVQFFPISVIHRTLTWTTGSLTCEHDHSYACVYTRGLGTPTTSQHNILTRKKPSHKVFLCSGRGSNLWSLDLESMLYQLSHPVTESPTITRSTWQAINTWYEWMNEWYFIISIKKLPRKNMQAHIQTPPNSPNNIVPHSLHFMHTQRHEKTPPICIQNRT